MKYYHFKRLEKLCVLLDKLPRKRFNFGIVVKHATECGTIGCAMGWTPAALPKLVEWRRNNRIALVGKKMTQTNYTEVAAKLFGMSTSMPLFDLCGGPYVHHSLPRLDEDATPKQVARMLRKFMRLVKEGKIQP